MTLLWHIRMSCIYTNARQAGVVVVDSAVTGFQDSSPD